MFSVRVVLQSSSAEIEENVLNEFKEYINKTLTVGLEYAKEDIKILLGHAIRSTPEYVSITSGELHYQLGLTDPVGVMGAIIDRIVQNITIKHDNLEFYHRGDIGLDVDVEVFKPDMSDVLQMPEATYNSKGSVIPWLRWLIVEGSHMVVTGYWVMTKEGNVEVMGKRASNYVPPSAPAIKLFPASRTGPAIMVPSGENGPQGYQIPQGYQGKIQSNFLTRALEDISKNVANIITQRLTEVFENA